MNQNNNQKADNFNNDTDIEGGAQVVMFSASADPGPLHRAEWIGFVAAFFNLERAANEYFAEVQQR